MCCLGLWREDETGRLDEGEAFSEIRNSRLSVIEGEDGRTKGSDVVVDGGKSMVKKD